MYIADLHIHSKYSRATSKECTPQHLDLWARKKGIHILGTGDFTHPAWRQELEEKLQPAQEGLYTLKEEYRITDPGTSEEQIPRFVISGEISSIYKKNGRVRKVHNVILLPSLEDADKLAKKLETIGNVHSDGRPILGLDCRDLLEIMLELCPRGIFVPAHIWTPHFSLFGAFSGFDTVEECFEDLTPYIHAMETGLSSDPAMNWQLSALDNYQLISNSDAHSPAKLGREANLLAMDLSYQGLYDAVQTGKGLAGTIEFFPEEGKYHYDGHRKCHLCLSPSQAEKYQGKCPVCGKKLTIGVSHRIVQLADRQEGFVLPQGKPYESLVPLPEVIGASMGKSSACTAVVRKYQEMLAKLGPEFPILREIPVEDIRHQAGELIGEGIRRLREGKVQRNPGFDGEYGTISLFSREELDNTDGQLSFFAGIARDTASEKPDEKPMEDSPENTESQILRADSQSLTGKSAGEPGGAPAKEASPFPFSTVGRLNENQEEAVTSTARAMAVIAGPGTGKTKTLVSRIVHLLQVRKVKPSEITAVTFTKKAASEMRQRLVKELGRPQTVKRMHIGTFHALCTEYLKDQGVQISLIQEAPALKLAKEAVTAYHLDQKPAEFLRLLSLWKTGESPQEAGPLPEAFSWYQSQLSQQELMDFDDLLVKALDMWNTAKEHSSWEKSFSYLLVDEFQDINAIQYRLISSWNQRGRELFVIGDPDQSIYGFRGSDSRCFQWLFQSYPEIHNIRLTENYRCTPSIVNAAVQVISQNPGEERTLHAFTDEDCPIRLAQGSTEMEESIFIAKEINRMAGGLDMLDVQGDRQRTHGQKIRSFGEIAVLYRTHRQGELLEKCLKKEGIPYTVTGREEFLEDPMVQGTLCFFWQMLHPQDSTAREQCLELLWGLESSALADSIRINLEEKYLPKLSKGKPGKILESWMEDLKAPAHPALRKLTSVSVFYKNMEELLESLLTDGEGDLRRCGGKSYSSDSVSLMTLHGAKGLEFPVVFLYGARKGTMPLEKEDRPTDEQEERRLFFVGMTRAKEELILTCSKEPSPFLEDISSQLLITEKAGSKKKEESHQMSLFDFMSLNS